MMPQKSFGDEPEELVETVTVKRERHCRYKQAGLFLCQRNASAMRKLPVQLRILRQPTECQLLKIAECVRMASTERQHRRQVVLQARFFIVARLASRNLRQIRARGLWKKFARENMIARPPSMGWSNSKRR